MSLPVSPWTGFHLYPDGASQRGERTSWDPPDGKSLSSRVLIKSQGGEGTGSLDGLSSPGA